ncbi:MAG: SLC13 family permease [Syntrophobacteraceae bacterium]|nr:SLC13 family permease [Syntrophobacteraceae bacterium]
MEVLNRELLTVFGVLAGAAVLFASNRLRGDVVAILVMLALMLSGILTVGESLAGFSQPVVLVIASMFIVGEALVHTGITQSVSEAVVRASGGSEARVMVLIMLVVGGIGAFMSSTAVVALFIPVALSIAREADLNRKRLLMPLSVAALISGMMTLIGTAPNLIVTDALRSRGFAPLSFFSFTPFGAVSLLVGITYMLVCGRRLLSRERHAEAGPQRHTIADLAENYGITEQLGRLMVLPGSPLVGKSVGKSRVYEQYGINLIGFEKREHGRHVYLPAHTDTVFDAGDAIFVLGDRERLDQLVASQGLALLPPLAGRVQREAAQGIGLAEIILPPGSRLIGQTLRDVEFRSRYSVTVLAVRRRGKPVTSHIGELRMDFGDALLVSGSWPELLRLRAEHECFVLLTLPDEYKMVAPARHRARLALIILAVMVVTMALRLVPMVAAAMLGAIALIAARCVRLDAVYRVISWQTVVLIAGILPLATALSKTGGTKLIADALFDAAGHMGPVTMTGAVFLLTSMTGLFISNSATAILVAPIVIDLASSFGVPPHAFAMTVAIACSAAYATPVSSPVNTLIMDPGGYTFMDFVKVGMPLQVLTLLVTVLLTWLLYLR